MKNVSKYIDFARVIWTGHKVKTVNVIGIPNIIASAQIRGMELQEKKHKKHYRTQKVYLERTYS